MSSVEQDFQDAQLGRGTRLLTHGEATNPLNHCERLGWAFQFMEAFECVDGLEHARTDLSIFGLTQAEKDSKSLVDLTQFARDRLANAHAEGNPFLFQVWIDLPDSIVVKRIAARSKN